LRISAAETFAQRGMKWQGSGNWGPETQDGWLYNPQAMENITEGGSEFGHNYPNGGDVHWRSLDGEDGQGNHIRAFRACLAYSKAGHEDCARRKS
jgi:hypothetical protein